MRYNHNTDALLQQLPEQNGKPGLRIRVQAFGRLVEQQHLRLQQHDHGQRQLLLLAAAKIMRMALQHLLKLKYLQQPVNLRLCRFVRQAGNGGHMPQFLYNGIKAEIQQRILGQVSGSYPFGKVHLTALRLCQTA
ncbi:hypothetical protein D3C80_1689320 [compost metagenome]